MTDLLTIKTNAETLAQLWGISKESVYKFVPQGMPRNDRGQYGVAECTRWFTAYLYERIAGGAPDLADERKGLVRAQRQREEIRNMQMLGDLLPAEQVATTLNGMATLFASQLDGLGARLAAKLAAIDDPAVIAKAVDDECRIIRVATSEAAADFASVGGSVGDTKPAAKKKRRTMGRRKSKTTARKPGAGSVAH